MERLTFISRQEVINFLSSYISEEVSEELHDILDDEVLFQICDVMAPNFIVADDSVIERNLIIRNIFKKDVYYAIHNDDLLLFKTVISSVLLFFSIENIKAVTIKLLSAIILLLYTFEKKSINLNCKQALILNTIKSNKNGINYNGICKDCKDRLNSKQVKDTLASLTEVRKNDGNITALIKKDSTGTWQTVDV